MLCGSVWGSVGGCGRCGAVSMVWVVWGGAGASGAFRGVGQAGRLGRSLLRTCLIQLMIKQVFLGAVPLRWMWDIPRLKRFHYLNDNKTFINVFFTIVEDSGMFNS